MTIRSFRRPLSAATAWAALLAPAAAFATNGYFAHGYGAKAQGLAGAGIALPLDALAAVTNPAGLSEIGDRLDVGLSVFAPTYSADVVGNAFGPDGHYDGTGRDLYFVPEIGYARKLSSELTAGLAVFGNGGLNSQYADNPYARFGGTGTAGVSLQQLFITPTLAWKLNESQTVAASLNVAYQRFYATGIGVFGGFSQAPANVSDQGTDTSLGVGLRLGWRGTVAPGLTLGATWASKVSGKFDKYKGLFADGGRLDTPSNYGVGIAYSPRPELSFAADVQRILYSRVAAIGNSAALLFAGQPLGSAGGPGFGWRDETIVKLGVNWQLSPQWTVRAGVSHGRQPVPRAETFFNILAPAVIENHLSFGATWTLPGGNELSGFVAEAFNHSVQGSGSIPPGAPPGGFGGGDANVRLKEHIFGIAYAWKL